MIDNLILIGSGALMAIICMLVGAYVMFKGKTSLPGERFIGGAPKGQAFTIPEAAEVSDIPESEEKILEKANKFLKIFEK